MSPFLKHMSRANFDPGTPSRDFSNQWTNPGDVFSILLILGGDVILRAIAQLAGSWVVPIAFSFGIQYA